MRFLARFIGLIALAGAFAAVVVDGARSIADVRNAVSAEFEPVELSAVAEYIDLLAKAGAVSFKP